MVSMNMNLNVAYLPGSRRRAGADLLQDFAKASPCSIWLVFLQRNMREQLLVCQSLYYTATTIDPVLAMVEMNNENSLYGYWKEGRLRPLR